MYRPKWESLFRAFFDNRGLPIEERAAQRLYVNKGRDRGQTGTLVDMSPTAGTLRFDDGRTAKIAYARLDHVGETGEREVQHMTDMLNDEIVEGAFVCYSQSTSYSHALEIGRVVGIDTGGKILVKPFVRNSEKAQMGTTYNYATRQRTPKPRTVDASRCLKIPVDTTRLMMGVLTDFESVASKFYE